MLRQPEPRKSSCPPRSSIASNQEIEDLSNKRTTAGYSCSSTGGSVVKPLRQILRDQPQDDVQVWAEHRVDYVRVHQVHGLGYAGLPPTPTLLLVDDDD
jgi:hypothetical protein